MCVLDLFQLLFLDQISFEIKQKSKYKVDFNSIFISIEKNILELSHFMEKIREPIKTLLKTSANLTLYHDDYFIARSL